MNKNPKDELAKVYKSELKEVKEKIEKIELSFDAEEDYKESRNTLKRLIFRSEEALDTLLELTRESEHPRAYEVLAGLLKTTGDLANQLVGLQKKRHELDVLNNPDKKMLCGESGGTTNNNLFVGSTTELQRFIRNEKGVVIDADSEE